MSLQVRSYIYQRSRGAWECRLLLLELIPPPQTTRSPSETLDEIGNYVYLFQRAHLVPGRPLSQLQPWSQPVVLYEQTTIWVFRSQFIVNIGTTSTYPMHTVLLAFIAPATLFQTPVPCGVHIPLCMWHNGVTQRRGPEFAPDHREPGFRIGARQVREAIHSHLLARWRVLHERMPRQPRNSLFGQVFVRQYVSARLMLPARSTF